MASWPRLYVPFRDAGDDGGSVTQLLLRESWQSVSEATWRGLELPSPGQREETLSAPRWDLRSAGSR
jgi:hypothetical protein